MNITYLLTGGNIGDRLAYLQFAAKLVGEKAGDITAQSPIYETAAWGNTNQGAFLNQVLEVRTALAAPKLLEVVLQIEVLLGRQRFEKMGPRTIDIDILLFNHDIINQPQLKVPHPELPNRRFVLTPLAALAGNYIHPIHGKTVNELLDACEDPLQVGVYHVVKQGDW